MRILVILYLLIKEFPKGLSSGPFFFLIFVNSLFSQRFRGKPTAFADDLGIVYGSSSALNLVADINHDVRLLSVWLITHRLVISNKTKLLFFNLRQMESPDTDLCFHSWSCNKFVFDYNCNCGRHNNNYSFNENLRCGSDCFTIEVVDKFKYLGVWIDGNLNWLDHISYLKQNFRVSLRHLFLLKKYLSDIALISIYHATFYSRLQYGVSCWGGTYTSYLQNLLLIQKKAIRLLTGASRLSPSMSLFKDLKILPVKHLYYYKVLKIFFIQSGYFRSPITDTRSLRSNSAFLVNIPSFRTSHFRNFYTIVACKLYNSLPLNLRLLKNQCSFLKQVKLWLLNFNHDEIINALTYLS